MIAKSKLHWDQKYEQGLPSLTKPDPFFLSTYERFIAQAFPQGGTALDVAGGLGRHALWLAAREWKVTLADFSEVALQKARLDALDLRVELQLVQGDAVEYPWLADQFDLILLFYHLDRKLFPLMSRALRPGGLLVCKLRTRWDRDEVITGDSDPLLGRSELELLTAGLDLVQLQQRPVGERGVVEYVGRKPVISPERIESVCPILVQLSTGVGPGVPLSERAKLVELKPKMASLNPCSMTFGNVEFSNPPDGVRRLAGRMRELGVKAELEVYDSGHVDFTVEETRKALSLS